MIDLPSPNQDDRPGGVEMLILHYTGMQSAQAAIDRLRDPAARVSSHYVIDEEGGIFRLVPEARRAWHAGISYWRGRRGLNDVSVGIEIVNPGHEWGYRPFPAAQMAAVTELSRGIIARHGIMPVNVVGHSDVAPTRKQDPGELFDWPGLAAAGVGLWPGGVGDGQGAADWSEARVRAALGEVGYDVADETAAGLHAVVVAFQRHWRPEAVSGVADAGTVLRLARLLAMVRA